MKTTVYVDPDNMALRRLKPRSLRLGSRLLEIERPLVMGILNVTPDSFYSRSRALADDNAALEERVSEMTLSGADIIDIGACSTRPGADDVTAREEIRRLRVGMAAVRKVAPEIPVSVDTFRADVARAAVEELGCDIVNDISGATMDADMAKTVAQLKVPFVCMHTRGTPQTMMTLTDYPAGVVTEVGAWLAKRIYELRQAGIADIIADPGLGLFAKTVEQNYDLLRATGTLDEVLDVPMLIGLSRKSMLTRPLGISPDDALPATVSANTVAMMLGASIIRVHDVKPAVEARKIVEMLLSQ